MTLTREMKRIYFLLLMAMGCSGLDYKTTYYQAVSLDKRDTASLRVEASAEFFHGDYQVRYDDNTSDIGTITGRIIGDTLVGRFNFTSRNNVKSVLPLVLLKSGENLKLGAGVAGTYMGFASYKRGSVFFNDSLFLFKPD